VRDARVVEDGADGLVPGLLVEAPRRHLRVEGEALRPTLALAALLFGAAARAEEKEGFGSLTVDQVAEHVAKGDASIFDNNPKDMWQKGHVPTAKWVDFKNVQASDLPKDKDRTLVFYCANEK